MCFLSAPPTFTSDPKCLHSLVSWAHHHGEACHFCPDLKEVLEGQCWGSVKAVWGCVDGHKYIMDTQCTNPGYTVKLSSGALGSGNGVKGLESEQEEDEEQPGGNERTPALAPHSPSAQTQSSALTDWTSNTEGEAFYNGRFSHGDNPERLETEITFSVAKSGADFTNNPKDDDALLIDNRQQNRHIHVGVGNSVVVCLCS